MSIEASDLKTSDALVEKMGLIFRASENIHKHTVKLGYQALHFIDMDNKYKISTPATFEETAAEILLFCADDAMVKTVLQKIREHENAPDNEAGLKVQDLLTKAWSMAKQFDDQFGEKFIVIDNLRQNKITKGGCYPGISARLIQPYTTFINALMQQRKHIELGVIEQQPIISQEQQELELAIQNSLSDKEPIIIIKKEKEDLELAMQLSLIEQNHLSSHYSSSSSSSSHYNQQQIIIEEPSNPFASDSLKARIYEKLSTSSHFCRWVSIASPEVIAVLTKMENIFFKALAAAKKPDGIFGVERSNGTHKPGLNDLPAKGLEAFFNDKNMIAPRKATAVKPLIFSSTSAAIRTQTVVNNPESDTRKTLSL